MPAGRVRLIMAGMHEEDTHFSQFAVACNGFRLVFSLIFDCSYTVLYIAIVYYHS